MCCGGWSDGGFRTDGIVDRIYQRAKQSDHTLSEAEILECVPTAAQKK